MHSFSRVCRSRRRSLPRGGLLQGMICGITAAIGYGPGVLAAFVWRAFADRPALEPIRSYAGLTSAEDSESRAAVAVEGLTRVGVSSAAIRSW